PPEKIVTVDSPQQQQPPTPSSPSHGAYLPEAPHTSQRRGSQQARSAMMPHPTQPHAPPSVTRCEEGGCDQAGTIDIPILINNQETGKGKLPKAQALVLARAQPQALKPTSGPSSGLHDTRSRPPGYTPRQGLTGTNSERHSHSPSPPENKAAAKSVGKRPRPESATPKPAPKKRQATIAQQPYATPNPRIGPSHQNVLTNERQGTTPLSAVITKHKLDFSTICDHDGCGKTGVKQKNGKTFCGLHDRER
ncbi:MAG: hypothetical protein CYPHOPRED_002137, partial [Cyphobasidiales sp. Tagirdzhanova-0007]